MRNSIDAIFTVNDGGGLAVVDVLAKAGRDGFSSPAPMAILLSVETFEQNV